MPAKCVITKSANTRIPYRNNTLQVLNIVDSVQEVLLINLKSYCHILYNIYMNFVSPGNVVYLFYILILIDQSSATIVTILSEMAS